MKNQIIKKAVITALAITLIGTTASVTSEAATPVISSSSLGGVYASGSCFYSKSSATAITSHALTSYKTVSVRGTYRAGLSIGYVSFGISGSYSELDVSSTVNLPAGASHFMGARGTHTVYYNDMTWGPVNSSIGEQ